MRRAGIVGLFALTAGFGCGGGSGAKTDAGADKASAGKGGAGAGGADAGAGTGGTTATAGTSGADAAAGTGGPFPNWSAPLVIAQGAPSPGGVAGPRIGLDGAGNAVAVWERPDLPASAHSLVAVSFDAATGRWGAATPLKIDGANEFAQPEALQPDLDVATAGSAVVVWRQRSGDYPSIWSSWLDPATKAWHDAALVETDDTHEASKPCVAALPGGGAVAVWEQWEGLRQNLWVNQLEGAPLAWTKPVLFETTDSFDASDPDLAADPAGNVTAVWAQTIGTTSVWTSRRDAATGAWSEHSMLGETGDRGIL